MSFHTDHHPPLGEMTVKVPYTPTSFTSESRESGRATPDACDSGCRVPRSLDRALVALGRDSVLRRKHLRTRWQGRHAIEGQRSERGFHPTAQELSLGRRIPRQRAE